MKPLIIRGTILALTRALYFERPPTGPAFHDQFQGLQWWRTERANRAIRALGAAATRAAPRLRFGDAKTFGDLLVARLQARLHASAGVIVPIPQRGSFFDAIQGDKPTFADHLWLETIGECEKQVGEWLTLYPLHKVTLVGAALQFGSIRVLSASAASDWRTLHTPFPALRNFEPQFGRMVSHQGFGFSRPAETWLVAEHTGTAAGARRRAGREMSEFIALVFAFAFPQKPGIFNKSGAEEETRTLQISDATINRVESCAIGELLPPLLTRLELAPALTQQIDLWYHKRAAAPAEKQERALAAADFLHHAAIADDVEQFLHLFIVVDALFGERHKVREKIKEGIREVFPGDASWERRTDLLMDLRSELVHGVISDLEDWGESFDYYDKFNASPSRDAMLMATTSLRMFFDLP